MVTLGICFFGASKYLPVPYNILFVKFDCFLILRIIILWNVYLFFLWVSVLFVEHILDDEDLVENLQKSRDTSQEIYLRVCESEEAEKQNQAARAAYVSVRLNFLKFLFKNLNFPRSWVADSGHVL